MKKIKPKWKKIPVAIGVAGVLGSMQLSAKAPLMALSDPDVIQGEFIVVLKQDTVQAATMNAQSFVQSAAKDISNTLGVSVERQFSNVMLGMAIRGSIDQIEQLRDNPAVEYIEANRRISVNDVQVNPPSWGIDRVDQDSLPLNNEYEYSNDGTGVHVYIVDTGIYAAHPDFAGRISNGTDKIDNDNDPADCHGHGTHVAGTAAGTTYGIAKGATIHGVRVLNCQGSGSNAGVIEGMDWVVANAEFPAVVNMSLGGGFSQVQNDAVDRMVDAGITLVTAAGNDGVDGCTFSPGSAPNAFNVGATDRYDSRVNGSWSSNWGSCLDIMAPGNSIVSASHRGSGSATMSGTSMAAPHVAGGVALYLERNPDQTPAEVMAGMLEEATAGILTNLRGSPNYLLRTNKVVGPPVDELVNHKPQADLSGSRGEEVFYKFNVTEGATDISVAITGGTGDADLYVRKGSRPTLSDFDCRPWFSGNEEVCDLRDSGTYYVMVKAYSAYSGVTLTGDYEPGDIIEPPKNELQNNEPVSIAAAQGAKDYYTFIVPDGNTGTISTTGGTGDLDLYVKLGDKPTESDYDCRPFPVGNEESCSLTQGGTYHVMIHAYAAYSGVTLLGKHTKGGGEQCIGEPEYVSNTLYYPGDQVQYQGKLYRATNYIFGQAPGTTIYWTLVKTC
ncbi:S8 family serine peptidase [Aliikangiella sp. IMCC44359]|uniref:S8 family serine peptidase n=1 Tax=Aliikangiella sp. IMCC44359 TaxID=3459125 RepID=UPI00403B20E4